MGIIDGKPLDLGESNARQALLEADVIFGCVFLGMVSAALKDGITLRWDVESLDAKTLKDAPEKQKTVDRDREDLKRVLGKLQRVGGLDGPDIEVGESPRYTDDTRSDDSDVDVFIAARPKGSYDGAGRSGKPAQLSRPVATFLRDLLENKALMEHYIDHEFGAYYGIVDDPANVQPRVVSSVRRLIPYGKEGGRWERGVPFHGLIGYDDPKRVATARLARKQAGSIETARVIQEWEGEGAVCGYCHGMIWAVAQQHSEFPHGTAYELGLGKNTHKLSSCFGCSTFQLANDRVPSSMHLGRSDSWVPLPDDPDAPFNRPLGQSTVFQTLNQRWAEQVAGWLWLGVKRLRQVEAGVFPVETVTTAERLQLAMGDRLDARSVANLFLDALTVHDKDLARLKRFAGIAG